MSDAAPAIGYSIVANIGGDRQLTLQCFVEQEETDKSVNTKMDRVFRIVDRAKARYEITDFQAELDKHEKALAQLVEDMSRIDAEFEKAQASLDVQASDIASRIDAEKEGSRAQHAQSGRQGSHKLGGATKANIQRLSSALSSVAAEKQKNVNERDQHRANVLISKARFEEEVTRLRTKVAEREALLKA